MELPPGSLPTFWPSFFLAKIPSRDFPIGDGILGGFPVAILLYKGSYMLSGLTTRTNKCQGHPTKKIISAKYFKCCFLFVSRPFSREISVREDRLTCGWILIKWKFQVTESQSPNFRAAAGLSESASWPHFTIKITYIILSASCSWHKIDFVTFNAR